METQDFLLEASRYLGMGYFDMLDELWGSKKISPNDDYLLEEATIKFSEMLKVTEDTYTKMLSICNLHGVNVSNSPGKFGMSHHAVSRFYMEDVIELAEQTSFFRLGMLQDAESTITSLRVEDATSSRAIDGIGTIYDTLKTEGDEKYAINLLDCKSGLPGILLYLYKHTRDEGGRGQTQFRWGARTNDLYRYKNGYIYVEDENTKEETSIPVMNFLSQDEDMCIGELNPLAINLLEKTWEKHTWEK